jgi:hypothetical protein
MGLLSPFLQNSVPISANANSANPANRDAKTDKNAAGLAGLAGLAVSNPKTEKCEEGGTPSLKPEIAGHLRTESFVAAVQAYWPGAYVVEADTSPSIVKEEPFGLDQPPPLLKAAWLRLLESCPEGVPSVIWEMAVFDLALLFGDWGKLITDFRWMPSDVFDYPAGLAWSIKGSPVLAKAWR